jgi:hypothetical protein
MNSNNAIHGIFVEGCHGAFIANNFISGQTAEAISIADDCTNVRLDANTRLQNLPQELKIDCPSWETIVFHQKYNLTKQRKMFSGNILEYHGPRNTVSNGSFENDTDHWTANGTAVLSISTTQGVTHGLKALKVNPSAVGDYASQVIELNPYFNDIPLVLHLNVDRNSTQTARVTLEVVGSDATALTEDLDADGEYWLPVITSSGAITQIEIRLYPDVSGGTAFSVFDDIYLGPGQFGQKNPPMMENGGLFEDDGGSTVYQIPHQLSGTPKKWSVTAASEDAALAGATPIVFHTSVDATNITVTFNATTDAGTDNVDLAWTANLYDY